ncbi:MAG: TRAP transporter large permease, partial [Syntrophaceae bacterium]|nr:TRAP transporter large permease [Syntrophaceae bacterium]NWF56379.1 TRAP transporter large permease [Syntrophaceae bacterium]
IKVSQAIKDVGIILLPMLLTLLVIVLCPSLILFLPRLIMPKFV